MSRREASFCWAEQALNFRRFPALNLRCFDEENRSTPLAENKTKNNRADKKQSDDVIFPHHH